MKPRTKLQHLVTELSNNLPRITETQKEWAYKECLEHRGNATKHRVLCFDCGETFSPTLVKRKRAVCPHCQTKITVKESRKTTDKQTNYFAITHVVDDFQVVKYFELIAYYKKGKQASYFAYSILEDWILPNGKVTKIGLKHTLNWYCDSWNSEWEIRSEGRSWHGDKYDVYARKYHPDSKIKPEYKKLGINHNLTEISFLEAIKNIPFQPKLETLIKAKQFSLLNTHINGRRKSVSYYWPSIKICLRNKYKVTDGGIWTDYIDLLNYFDKDIRNPKYVCPKNLKKEHDRLVEKKRIVQAKRELENKRRQAEQDNKFYLEQKAKFFNLVFKSGQLIIVPLKSVQEFIEEGDKLKHCVFTNRYFEKEDTLILSARIENEPIETIEVDLKKLKIIQARGYKNNPTDHHKQIISLVKKNIPKIKSILKSA